MNREKQAAYVPEPIKEHVPTTYSAQDISSAHRNDGVVDRNSVNRYTFQQHREDKFRSNAGENLNQKAGQILQNEIASRVQQS